MSFVLASLVFNVIPTAVEISMVSAIFCGSLGPEFAYMTLGSVGMYATATLAITQWRTKFRHEMNQADNDAGNKAVDSLINYETVKIEDVHFGYLPEKPILNGLTMEIPAGKKVAVVGGSGSGKSTLVRLLYRLYDADSGHITVNGIDIHDLKLNSLRRAISVVPQVKSLGDGISKYVSG
ncbi:unnamed protein product [Strongylus vulgaris]|uniref:Iron-sulfur clusters transporter ABCB7, mitochondrial n=1 Tax=Strongylus vulgaris TaxID=40348 RepID=A0A3P7J0R2_STRVU|nr:unnamed protein product [Strongylus vulgaris]